MAADDWFRNATWSAEIAERFEQKLARAKRKEQYLRIQACTLARAYPHVALALLDRYFELPDQLDRAQAYVDRANAYVSLGRFAEAVRSFNAALVREAEFPHLQTQAYVDLPFLVATEGLTAFFARAREVLATYQARLMFPVDHFKWNAAQALIAHAEGERDTPYAFAREALAAADRIASGFRNHPAVGLVTAQYSDIQVQLRRLCDA